MIEFERSQHSEFGFSSKGASKSSGETTPQTETDKFLISPESLYADNRSELAHLNMIEWDLNRYDGKHVVTAACADARLEIPMDKSNERIHTIATGGPKNPYENLLKSRNISSVVILAHHDGDTVIPGQMPTGCGGLGAKAEIKRNGKKEDPVLEFVDKDIEHEDVIVQACMSALKVSALTDKPVLAATQDHLTGEIHPQLAFWTDKDTSYSAWNRNISIQDLLDSKKYDPLKIYNDGLPCLDINMLPEVFQEYIQANRKEMDTLHDNFPDFRQRQKIQNPSTVIMTTDIRPTRLKYPSLFTEPGSFFRLTIPRIKNSKGEDISVDFSQEEIDRVFQQVKYPIDHFSNVKNVIIETPNYNWSERIGYALSQQEWIGKWKKKDGAQITVVETRGGKIYQPNNLVFK